MFDILYGISALKLSEQYAIFGVLAVALIGLWYTWFLKKQVMANGESLDADVLKVGHHGSTTSSSKEFIKEVSPNIAVIPVGEGNDYGHPHKEILDLLENNNIELLRTDLEGTIVLESDGNSIRVIE